MTRNQDIHCLDDLVSTWLLSYLPSNINAATSISDSLGTRLQIALKTQFLEVGATGDIVER